MSTAIGIDLGTTNSLVAYIDRHGKPEIIPNDLNNLLTPSVICFQDENMIFGEEAKELQALGTYPVAAFFKRQIADEQFVFYANGKDYSAQELSCLLLKKLKRDAEQYLGKTVSDAVITVPAYFKDRERSATIKAGEQAGFNVLQVINEPTAAAIAYGASTKINQSKTIMVYDLGGGTFDITLLEVGKGKINVISSQGNHQLGGKDWDDRIIEHLASLYEDEYGSDPLEDAESVADLLIYAEEAKKRLSSFGETSISIIHNGQRGKYMLSRHAFEEITKDLMELTVSEINQVLLDCNLQHNDVDEILLVGGSTRMPMVSKYIEEKFSKKPVKGVNVDEAVALGAAIVAEQQANLNSGGNVFSIAGNIRTVDVTNHSLGMIAVNNDHTQYVNSIILPKNKPVPCNQSRPYQHRTRSNSDNLLEVFITQGETGSPADVSYIGRYVVDKIPHNVNGLATLDINYLYNESGVVRVSVRERESGLDLPVRVESLPVDVPERFLVSPADSASEVAHISAYLVFDVSGSMSGRPIKEAQKAAHNFVKNIDLNHCSLGIMVVSDRVKTKLEASQNAKHIAKAINEITVSETGVCNNGHPFCEIRERMADVSGRRFAVVLADGCWAYQGEAVKEAKRCHQAEIDIISIGFGSADKQFLKDIASSDEDSFFTSTEKLTDTFSTIAQVMTETGGGLTLGSGKPPKRGLFSNV